MQWKLSTQYETKRGTQHRLKMQVISLHRGSISKQSTYTMHICIQLDLYSNTLFAKAKWREVWAKITALSLTCLLKKKETKIKHKNQTKGLFNGPLITSKTTVQIKGSVYDYKHRLYPDRPDHNYRHWAFNGNRQLTGFCQCLFTCSFLLIFNSYAEEWTFIGVLIWNMTNMKKGCCKKIKNKKK